MTDSRTVTALLSGSGRGAIATVVVDGPSAIACVSRCFQPAARIRVSDLVQNLTYFGSWTWRDYVEELVICRTTPEQVEIHCHGGNVAAGKILESLTSAGAQRISTDAWLERTEPDYYVREAKRLLPAAKTERTLAILLSQIRGAMRNQLTEVQALVDAGELEEARSRIRKLVDSAPLGSHLTTPWSVVLIGPPNTGKSSLINAIVGFDRAVVFDQPGTTRDLVSASAAIDGWPVLITDTAGIRESNNPIESEGIRRARSMLAQTDLALLMQDLTAGCQDRVSVPETTPSLKVGTKLDLAVAADHDCDVSTSAVTGDGITELLQLISQTIVPEPPDPGDAVSLCKTTTDALHSCLKNLRTGDHDGARRLLAELLSR